MSKIANIVFENLESFSVNLDKLSFQLKNGLIHSMSFNLNDSSKNVVWHYNCSVVERIKKFNDICAIVIDDMSFDVNWQGNTDSNPCQIVSTTGDDVFIKYFTVLI